MALSAAEPAGLPQGRRAFRPEVQALRALAVAGVVAFHLWPGVVRGGYVGVDVFFVISGFLITQHLVAEADRRGRVRLTEFYARRIRRILPAAFVVLGACVLLTMWALPSVARPDNLGDIGAAAAYVENWQLGRHAVDYLAAEHSPTLVQHYWSLSVEEQFYLLWPLLVIGAAAAARRSGRGLRHSVVAVLGAATAVSFVVSIVWTRTDAPMAFFATPTRAWEFGVGGLVGVLLPDRLPDSGAARRAILGWAGLAIVIATMLLLSRDNAFPGAVAAWPVLGAAMVVAAGAPDVRRSPVRLQSNRAVQWVGNNSYSVYLWHWPLIIAAPWVLHGSVNDVERVIIGALSLALADLTRRLVEDPIRVGAWWQRRAPAYALAAAGVAGLLVATTTLTAHVKQAERKTVAAAQAQSRAAAAAARTPRRRSCIGAAAMLPDNACAQPFARPHGIDPSVAATDGPKDPCLQKFDAATPAPCVLGARVAPRRTIALVGNSHAWRLIVPLRLYAEQHRWQLIVYTRINCLGLITTALGPHGASANCLQWSRSVQRRLLATPHLDAVVFASYRFADEFLEGNAAPPALVRAAQGAVLATWQRFVAAHIRIVVPGDVPGMRPRNDPDCLAQSTTAYDPCSVSRSKVDRPNLVAEVAQAHPEVATFVPLTQYFCDATRCHGVIGGLVVYFDSHHMTTSFAQTLAPYLGGAIANALAR